MIRADAGITDGLATCLFFEGRIYPLSAMLYLVAPVLSITGAMSAINVFITRARTVQTHEAAAGQAPARFLDRLPPRLRGAQLIAVQSEDHYLRLHTDRGSDLILMRLADALSELEGLEGAQTHRSWWVAQSAIAGSEKSGRDTKIVLATGLRVPVARGRAAQLKDAGLI